MAKKAYIGVDGKARKVKKGYIGVENFVKRALPSGYTQVEYIQSSGTQYVDTGFKPNNNTRVVMDAQATATGTYVYWGTRTGTLSKAFCCFAFATSVRSDYGTTQKNISTSKTASRVIVEQNKNVCTHGGLSVSHDAQTFQCDFPLYLLAANTNGSVEYASMPAKVYSCQIYDNGTLVRDYIPCISPSGTAGLYDIVNDKFYANAGSGTFATGATYKGIARKIKKAYIGIGGVARPCWSGGELAYYGTITPLSTARGRLAATSVGNYALFGGGQTGSGNGSTVNTVDAYNASLTRSTPTGLNIGVSNHAATTVGDYALFGGGQNSSSNRSEVTAYSASLTKRTPMSLDSSREHLAATSIGNYALFGGGKASSAVTTVDAYNTSLTHSYPTALSSARRQLAATTTGKYALFGGSDGGKVVDAYNASLTRSVPTALSVGRYGLGAASVGDYALFAGTWSGGSAVVDVYDASLTRTTAPSLSVARGYMATTAVENYALFGGGLVSSDASMSNVVDVYDDKLTKTIMTSLNTARAEFPATSVGNYALFGGGIRTNQSTTYSTVDAYTVA